MINVSDNFNIETSKCRYGIKRDKFNKICRICLVECEITNIFELHYNGHFISDLIFYCCTVQVIKNDEYPQNICTNCINQLIISFEFMYKSCKSDELLKSVISEVKDAKQNIISTEVTLNLEKNKAEDAGRTNEEKTFSFDSDENFTDVDDLKKTKPKAFPCTSCSKLFPCKDGLTQHLKTHTTTEKPYQCELCFASFSINRNLKRHIMIHTGEKPYTCDECGKSFNQLVTLKGHMRSHTGERPYVCNYCGKALKYSSELKAHKDRHLLEDQEGSNVTEDGSDKLKCNVCKEVVSSRRALRLHKSISHVQKNHLCSICGKGFVGKQGLVSHLKTHTGEKPFRCQFCSKSFAHKMTLKDHELIHTGEKPHECKICKKRFIQHHHLAHHMRTHTGEKPYVCQFCKNRFALKGNLTVHIRTHMKEKPYICSTCGRGFYDSSSLKKHKRYHFNKNVQEIIN